MGVWLANANKNCESVCDKYAPSRAAGVAEGELAKVCQNRRFCQIDLKYIRRFLGNRPRGGARD